MPMELETASTTSPMVLRVLPMMFLLVFLPVVMVATAMLPTVTPMPMPSKKFDFCIVYTSVT